MNLQLGYSFLTHMLEATMVTWLPEEATIYYDGANSAKTKVSRFWQIETVGLLAYPMGSRIRTPIIMGNMQADWYGGMKTSVKNYKRYV